MDPSDRPDFVLMLAMLTGFVVGLVTGLLMGGLR